MVDKNQKPSVASAGQKDTVKSVAPPPSLRPYVGTTREDMRRDTYTPAHRNAGVNAMTNR